MKRFVLLTFILAFITISCNNKNTQERLLTQQRLQDSIQSTVVAKDKEVNGLFKSLNAIEQSLATVNIKYGQVKELQNAKGEAATDQRVRITTQINQINEILRQNKEKIQDLNDQLLSQKYQYSEAISFVHKLEARIDEQELQIQTLTSELQQKNLIIDNLNKSMNNLISQNEKKDEHIIKVENEKNTVYYIIGSRNELIKKGIISKYGGFIGIATRTTPSANSDLSQYTKADLRKLNELPLTGKKIKILTFHPTNSYTFEGNKKRPSSLKIEDNALFWSKSKFLIIMYQ